MFTRLSVALVGSLAVATQATYGHHQKHETSKALGGYGNQTTSATPSSSNVDNSPTGVEGSIVYETIIATVTSCESTVKHCPATTAPYVTTSVVPVHPTSSSAAVSSGNDEHPSSTQKPSSTLDAAPSSSHPAVDSSSSHEAAPSTSHPVVDSSSSHEAAPSSSHPVVDSSSSHEAAPSSSHPVVDSSSSYEAMPSSTHPAAGNETASTTPVSSSFDNSPTGAVESPSSSHPVAGNETASTTPVSSGYDNSPTGASESPSSSHPAAGSGSASTTPVSSGFDNSPIDTSKSVIYETVVATVTSCESTVKDCPATTAPYVVTSVVTVVPTKSGDAMPSKSRPVESNVDSAVPSVPLTTGGPSNVDDSPVVTGDHTLTYTQGTGSSKTVITTTIKMTSTQTNINTVYATSSGADSAPTGESEDGSKGEDGSKDEDESKGDDGSKDEDESKGDDGSK
ncbi:MAG: hypothetical protein Q9183_003389, partial [Haloplaca sp. 2 TL-2023]